jgi:caffeoyl-CoA O-methyltransferase
MLEEISLAFKKWNAYCEGHSSPPSPLLRELERETHLKTLAPQMISGPLQGQFLRFLSLLMQPKRILEIGTFTGYAALCLAEGLPEDGKLFTVEGNKEIAYLTRKYIRKAGLEEKVILHIGDAKSWIPGLEETFDLVFIDAGKNDYALYYDLVIPRLRPGGIILADNVLWSGKVVDKAEDPDTLAIQAFNDKVLNDPAVENLILPLRDGLMMIRKKG